MPASWRLLSMAAIVTSAALGIMLPARLGEFARGTVISVPLSTADRLLYDEYGLRATERSSYIGPGGASLEAEAWRFGDSGGAHAAYLFLRPDGAAPSPLAEYIAIEPGTPAEIHASAANGVTIAGYRNYVFRFQGAAPTTGQFERMLASLREVDPAEPGSDGCSPSLGAASEHILRGPISLEKFAGRIPAPVAAFELGARGCVERLETPSGPLSRIVFEYPSAATALARIDAFRKLSGARVRLAGQCVGLVFDASEEQAQDLLQGITAREAPAGSASGTISWEPAVRHSPIGWGAVIGLWGFILVGAVAVRLYRARVHPSNPPKTAVPPPFDLR